MADNIKYRFIQNVGDYFPSGYFGEDFLEKVQKCAGLSNEDIKIFVLPLFDFSMTMMNTRISSSIIIHE